MHHVGSYSKGEPCVMAIAGGESVEISRRKKQEFLERVKGQG